METRQRTPRSIDVTGLPEEAIQAVESLVSLLRRDPNGTTEGQFVSRDEWVKEFHRWIESHELTDPTADDSRESIYATEDQ
jgi:hypothetical protein